MSETLINIVLVVAAWAVSGLITYGYMKAKISEFERRLLTLEHTGMPRVEYENRHADLLRQLDRIENKVEWRKGT